MTNMSIQPLWLTSFIEILLVLEFQLTKTYFGKFSYKAHFRPQISSNAYYFDLRNSIEIFQHGNGTLGQFKHTTKVYIPSSYCNTCACEN